MALFASLHPEHCHCSPPQKKKGGKSEFNLIWGLKEFSLEFAAALSSFSFSGVKLCFAGATDKAGSRDIQVG